MDDPMSNADRNKEIARRLAAYAEEQLSPDPATVARLRARVMAAASAQLAPAGRTAGADVIPFRRRMADPRRVVGALLAASLAVVLVTGAAFAAEAGGPLYGVRLWVETVSLPTDAAAREEADLVRLDARVREAARGAAEGNGSAVAAALAAYREILEDAVIATGDVASRADRLQAAMDRHLDVLEGLLDKVPAQARDSIERAIAKQSEASDRAGGSGKPKPTKAPGDHPTPKPGGGKPTDRPGGGNGSGGDGNGPKGQSGR
jgi:hypothetical protein